MKKYCQKRKQPALYLRRHCMLKPKIETPAVGFGFEFGWFFMLTRKIMIILLRILSLFSGSCGLFGFLSKLADFHVKQWNKYMEIYVQFHLNMNSTYGHCVSAFNLTTTA